MRVLIILVIIAYAAAAPQFHTKGASNPELDSSETRNTIIASPKRLARSADGVESATDNEGVSEAEKLAEDDDVKWHEPADPEAAAAWAAANDETTTDNEGVSEAEKSAEDDDVKWHEPADPEAASAWAAANDETTTDSDILNKEAPEVHNQTEESDEESRWAAEVRKWLQQDEAEEASDKGETTIQNENRGEEESNEIGEEAQWPAEEKNRLDQDNCNVTAIAEDAQWVAEEKNGLDQDNCNVTAIAEDAQWAAEEKNGQNQANTHDPTTENIKDILAYINGLESWYVPTYRGEPDEEEVFEDPAVESENHINLPELDSDNELFLRDPIDSNYNYLPWVHKT